MKHGGVFAVLLLLVPSACGVDASLGDEIAVDCASNQDCPAGFICNPNSNSCVDGENPDFVPPTLDDFIVTPAILGPGGDGTGLLTVAVEFSEPLAVLPELVLLAPSGNLPLDVIQGRPGDAVFEATRLVTATEPKVPEDVALAVVVVAEDYGGNRVETLVEEAVILDFEPPRPAGARLDIRPAPNSPLGVVDARLGGDVVGSLDVAGLGSVVVATLELSEVVDDPATQIVLFATDGTNVIDFEYSETVEGQHTFRRAIGSEPEGAYSVRIVATDDLGNSLPSDGLEIGALRVDRTAPAPVAVDSPDAVIYSRMPWGTDANGGEARFSVVGAPGAAAGAAYVLAIGADGFGGGAIGATTVEADGSFTLPVDPPDRRDLFVVTLDGAGNLAPPQRVRDVVFVATMGAKIAGSTADNPHRFLSVPRWDPSREQASGEELAQGPLLEAHCPDACGVGSASTDGSGYWKTPVVNGPEGAPLQTFLPRQEMAVGYDPLSDEVFVFGGWYDGQPASRESWSFEGSRWTRRSLSGPAPRRGARMVTMPVHVGGGVVAERLVLYGGRQSVLDSPSCPGSNFVCSDSWYWNGFSWTSFSPTGPQPPARGGHGMAYDELRQRTVVYGGQGPSGRLGDTWELGCNGSGCSWNEFTSAGPVPARESMAMSFDGRAGGLVMWGGTTSTGDVSDFWERIGTGWSRQTLSVAAPVSDHWAVYDESKDVVLGWGLAYTSQPDASLCQRPPVYRSGAALCVPFLFGNSPIQAGSSYAVYNPSSTDVVVFSRMYEPGKTFRWNAGSKDRPAHLFEVNAGTLLGGGLLSRKIDFTGDQAPAVPGWERDTGELFGLQGSLGELGWTCTPDDAEIVGGVSEDGTRAELNSYLHASFGFQSSANYECSWNLAVPNGTYNVVLWIRDADNFGVGSGFRVEGSEELEVSSGAGLVASSFAVTVSDGNLSVETFDPDLGDGIDPDHAIAAIEVYEQPPVEEISLRWDGGSSSNVDGTDFFAWDGLAWVPIGSLSEGPGQIGSFLWTPSLAEARRFFRTSPLQLSVVAVPSGTNGKTKATVATDYVEAAVKYRLRGN